MRLELPTLLPAPGGITLGAGSRCGLEGAEHCGVVAALGVAGGAAAGSPPARSRGRLCRATSTALGAGLGIFPSLDFMGLLLAPSSHVQRSEQQLCCNTWAWGGDGSVLSILLWEPHTGATSGQGVHIHAESCKMPERGATGAGGPMASSCSAQTLLGHPEELQVLFPALRAGSNVPGVSGGCGAGALQGIVRVPALSPAAHGGCSWIIPAACWGLVRCKCWAAGEGQGEPCCQHTGCGSPAAGGAGIKTPVRPGQERHCPGSLLPAAEGEQSRGVS